MNQPATALPWTAYKANVHALGHQVTSTAANPKREHDAAYIAHAANAYPKLVAALHDYVSAHGGAKGTAILRELGELE